METTTFPKAIKAIMAARGYTQNDLAEAFDIKVPTVNRSINGTPYIRVAERYLAAMGYHVALVPDGAKLPDGSYVLEDPFEIKGRKGEVKPE